MADSNTEESSPVVKDDNINAIPETSYCKSRNSGYSRYWSYYSKELKEAGIVSVMDLAVTSADRVSCGH